MLLHSLKTESKNGHVGTLVGCLEEKDRFVVKVDGKEQALRARNLRLVDDEKNEDDNGIEERMTTEKLMSALFRPGTLFLGTIQIPGLQGLPGRNEYRLIIDSDPILDEMGQPTGILARHWAYDDEQFVWIQVETNDDNSDETVLTIQYADGETQCRGVWNSQKAQFEGAVRQLLPTEDGGSIYHTRDEVTHTFTLSPATALHPDGIAASLSMQEETTDDDNREGVPLGWEKDLLSPLTGAIAEHRSKTDKLCFALVGQFRELSEHVGCWRMLIMNSLNEEERKLIRRMAKVVAWRELLVGDALAAEKMCATLRRWAELLDSLSFASPEERTAVLAMLKEKGISRALAHSESDEWKESARSIIQAFGNISTIFLSSNGPDASGVTRIFILCSRLERTFARFDGALRRAEERLTEADICRWVVLASRSESRTAAGEDAAKDETLCAICRVALEEEGTQFP